MNRPIRFSSFAGTACVLAVLIVLTGSAWARNDAIDAQRHPEPDRVVDSVDPGRTTQMGGRLPAWVTAAHAAGRPAPELQLDHLTLLLARSPERERAFRQRLEDQQNPHSPEYHHWLTPEQIGEQYGVTQHDIDAVQGWLQSQGLRVEQVSKSRTVVSFSGTVAQVEAAVSVRFARYGLAAEEAAAGTPRERLSVSTRPRVPSALTPVVQAFGGLSQIPVHPYGHAEVRKMAGGKPEYSYCNSQGTECQHFISPQDFATIFDLNTIDGVSRVIPQIAIVGRSRFDPDDIQNFRLNTDTAGGATTLIPATGTEPGTTNDGDQLEATIDVIRALSTSPASPIDLIISADSSTQSGIYTAGLYEVDTVLDPVMNISFGACEADAGADGVSLWDDLASQAAGEGISIFVSSGDAGAAGCDRNNATPPATQVKSPNYICSSSYVTCVGGTEFNDMTNPAQYWSSTNSYGLSSALSYIPEGGWNEPTYTTTSGSTAYQASASGGGVSSIITKPSWQTGTGVPDDGFRDTPDVAFPSAGHDGFYACAAFIGADCSHGYFAVVFGTSTAAPSMAGIAAQLDEARILPLGNLNPLLYATAALPSSGAFHDTTVESSGVSACSLATPSMCNNSTPSMTALTGGLAGYQLGTGYDQVTGLGSLDVGKFGAAALPPLLTPTILPSPLPTQVTTSQSFPLIATVTGSGPVPTGSVTWYTALDGRYSFTAPLVNGVATVAAQIPITGQYFLAPFYSGDANYVYAATDAPQTPVLVVAATTGALSPTVLISANPSTINLGQSTVFTATVQGSGAVPTGMVQFLYEGRGALGPPVALVNGTASSSPQVFVHRIVSDIIVEYLGDAQYQGGFSEAASLIVQEIPAPMFAISASSLTLAAGQTTANSTAVSVSSSNNYNDTITFTCQVIYTGSGKVNDLPTCSLSSAGTASSPTLTLSPSAPTGTLTATIGTVAASGGAQVASAQEQSGGAIPGKRSAAGLAGLFMLGVFASRTRAARRSLLGVWLLLGVLLGSVAGLTTGCGGGGGGGTTTPIAPIIPGTTAGVYAVAVIGASRTFTTYSTFTLTVQ